MAVARVAVSIAGLELGDSLELPQGDHNSGEDLRYDCFFHLPHASFSLPILQFTTFFDIRSWSA